MKLEEKLEQNAILGADILTDYLKGKASGGDKVKYASLAITQHCKHIATKGVVDAIKFGVCRAVSANPEELKKHIAANLPEYSPVKQIGK